MSWSAWNYLAVAIGLVFLALAWVRGQASDGSGQDSFLWAGLSILCNGGAVVSWIIKGIWG